MMTTFNMIFDNFDFINLICIYSSSVINEINIKYVEIIFISLTSIYYLTGRGQRIFNSIIKRVTFVAGGAAIVDKVKGQTQKITKVRAEVVKLRQPLQHRVILVTNNIKKINKFFILIKVMFNNLLLSIRERYFKSNIEIFHSFVFPLILSKLNLSEGLDHPKVPVITSYYLAVFLLSFICLLCFINE